MQITQCSATPIPQGFAKSVPVWIKRSVDSTPHSVELAVGVSNGRAEITANSVRVFLDVEGFDVEIVNRISESDLIQLVKDAAQAGIDTAHEIQQKGRAFDRAMTVVCWLLVFAIFAGELVRSI